MQNKQQSEMVAGWRLPLLVDDDGARLVMGIESKIGSSWSFSVLSHSLFRSKVERVTGVLVKIQR